MLPSILNCREFINADSIAAGLSPFNPENVALEAGRIMLQRIDHLLTEQSDFAFETTLSTRSYVSLVKRAKTLGYNVTLLYFWLSSPEFARQRVAERVETGGHNIPEDVIIRRYHRGIYNLVNLYIPICDEWLVLESMETPAEIIAKGNGVEKMIIKNDIWGNILTQSERHGK
ncbi:zeta toxin family protein [Chitinophaga pinensis]|uniref:zeta toxin family protein n=1 Tax=Chitinophaga pinensis TaxID=79329 RepID=UPI00019E38A6|nr:zeta toxin family protein [Chitinophaga pinensis]